MKEQTSVYRNTEITENKKSTENSKSSIFSSRSIPKQTSLCLACHKEGKMLFYSCCFKPCCGLCYQTSHFDSCAKLFNKNVFPLSEESSHDDCKDINPLKMIGKCSRCCAQGSGMQSCLDCKIRYCKNCMEVVHRKGKFLLHRKQKNLVKQYSVNNEVKNSQKKSGEETRTPIIRKSKVSEGSSIQPSNELCCTLPVRAKSISPTKRLRQGVMNQPQKSNNACYEQQGEWQKKLSTDNFLNCTVHHKTRTILTEECEFVCSDCFEVNKTSMVKLKALNFFNMQPVDELTQLQLLLDTLEHTSSATKGVLMSFQENFNRLRHQLKVEYQSKKEQLEERYQNNLNGLLKWENISTVNLCEMLNESEEIVKQIHQLGISQPTCEKMKREELLETVYRLRLLIFTEELSKCKKEALNYLDLYTYRVNAIPGGQFDETLRFFNVVRRKNHNNDNDTSFSGLPGSRCQRSNSKFKLSGLLLSSSKIVNTSTGTDRKRKKTDSLTSNYQQLNVANNSRRNSSKEFSQFVRRQGSKELNEFIRRESSSRALFTSYVPSGNKSYKDIINMGGSQEDSFLNSHCQKNTPAKEKQIKYLNMQCFKDVPVIKTDRLTKQVSRAEVKQMLNPVNQSTDRVSESSSILSSVQMVFGSNSRIPEGTIGQESATQISEIAKSSQSIELDDKILMSENIQHSNISQQLSHVKQLSESEQGHTHSEHTAHFQKISQFQQIPQFELCPQFQKQAQLKQSMHIQQLSQPQLTTDRRIKGQVLFPQANQQKAKDQPKPYVNPLIFNSAWHSQTEGKIFRNCTNIPSGSMNSSKNLNPKSKRKSDYMDLRDRMRKPQLGSKIPVCK